MHMAAQAALVAQPDPARVYTQLARLVREGVACMRRMQNSGLGELRVSSESGLNLRSYVNNERRAGRREAHAQAQSIEKAMAHA